MNHLNFRRFAWAGALLVCAFALRAAVPDPVDLQWKRKVTENLGGKRSGGANIQKSSGVSDACLFFVAPKTTGLTAQELPSVIWYISQPAKQVVFTLVRFDTKKTVLRLELSDVKPGFHKIDLAAESKTHKIEPLAVNTWSPDAAAEPRIDALYRMGLASKDLELAAVSYIARVKAPQGVSAGKIDFGLAVKNELWFDAVQTLCTDLRGDPNANKQLKSLLASEEVLRTQVAESAPQVEKDKAQAEEKKVFEKLSVPDPVDLQSDTWKAPAADN